MQQATPAQPHAGTDGSEHQANTSPTMTQHITWHAYTEQKPVKERKKNYLGSYFLFKQVTFLLGKNDENDVSTSASVM